MQASAAQVEDQQHRASAEIGQGDGLAVRAGDRKRRGRLRVPAERSQRVVRGPGSGVGRIGGRRSPVRAGVRSLGGGNHRGQTAHDGQVGVHLGAETPQGREGLQGFIGLAGLPLEFGLQGQRVHLVGCGVHGLFGQLQGLIGVPDLEPHRGEAFLGDGLQGLQTLGQVVGFAGVHIQTHAQFLDEILQVLHRFCGALHGIRDGRIDFAAAFLVDLGLGLGGVHMGSSLVAQHSDGRLDGFNLLRDTHAVPFAEMGESEQARPSALLVG